MRPALLQLVAMLHIQQGRLDAALSDYDALAADGGADAKAHQARGDLLHALGRPGEALAAYDLALSLAPGLAAAHANRALALLDLGRAEEAAAACDAALALTPGDAALWANRSAALRAAGRPEAALESARRALSLRPDFADAFNAEGLALATLNAFDAALVSYDQALAHDPGHRDALNNSGVALAALGRFEEARARHAVALAVDPDFAEAEYNLGLLELRLGENGWRRFEARWRRRGEPGPTYPNSHLWLGAEDVAGRTVLLHAEQGLGDTIQFARYAPQVKALGARVVLQVQPALARLMGSLVGVDEVCVIGQPLPPVDLHIPLMSLPLVFGVERGAAYLGADPARKGHLSGPAPFGFPHKGGDPEASPDVSEPEPGPRLREGTRIGGARDGGKTPSRLKVGLVWSGNPKHGNDRNRSIPLAALAPLFERQADFLSLQPEVRPADAAILAASPVTPMPPVTDFADTAALMADLDLVITVDTSAAHLAGALGRPTWVLLPRFPDWRWGEGRADSPWYPTLRLFRQARFGDWTPVIAEVGAALDAVIGSRLS